MEYWIKQILGILGHLRLALTNSNELKPPIFNLSAPITFSTHQLISIHSHLNSDFQLVFEWVH